MIAHEEEHVRNNARDAEQKGMDAYSTVTISVSRCPECGRMFISGGKTSTVYTSKQPTLEEEIIKGLFVNLTI